jgi:hypothetical protein
MKVVVSGEACAAQAVAPHRYHAVTGDSAQFFDKITLHALRRLAGFIAQRHKRRKSYGWWVVAHQTRRMGLIDLNGTIVAPRPTRSRRRGS